MIEKSKKSILIGLFYYLLIVISLLFIPLQFQSLLFGFANANELWDYLKTLVLSLISLIIISTSLKITKAYKGKIFYVVVTGWFLIELLVFYVAVNYYFIYVPYGLTESIYDEEEFAHIELNAYLFLIAIMVCQTIKVFLITKEPIKYLTRKFLEIRAKLLKIK